MIKNKSENECAVKGIKRRNGMDIEIEQRQRKTGYMGCFIITIMTSLHAMQSTLLLFS